MNKRLAFCHLLMWFSIFSTEALGGSKQPYDILVEGMTGNMCQHGLHYQPSGSFAIMAFCEDAEGTYIGVVCYAAGKCQKATYPDGTERFIGWSYADRLWQEKIWASDVTSIAWSLDQKTLFVGTSEIYGSGGLYELDLEKRQFKQLLPTDRIVSASDPGPGYEIVDVAKDGSTLSYKLQQTNDEKSPTILKLFINR